MQPTDPNRVRAAAWILAAPGLALAATCVLSLAGAGGDWIGAAWLAAVLWIIAASIVQALWTGFRRGDWSAFTCEGLAPDDEGHSYFTRTGSYAYLRIRDRNEALTRDGDRFLEDPDHSGARS